MALSDIPDKEDGSKVLWWREKRVDPKQSQIHRNIYAHVEGLEEEQKSRFLRNVRHAHLYGDEDALALDHSRPRPAEGGNRARTAENVIRSVCDTAASIVAKNRVKATFMTEGGNYSLQIQAKQREKFCEGIFNTGGIYKEGPRIFRDATIFDAGIMKGIEHDGHIWFERVLPDELIVDIEATRHAPPREFHRRKFVPLDWLVSQYPDRADEIKRANKNDKLYAQYRSVETNYVVVIESHYVPPKIWMPGAEFKPKGRRTIVCETCTLVDEEWKLDISPYIVYYWDEPLWGFWGSSLVAQLRSNQRRLNKMNKKADKGEDLIAVPRMFLPSRTHLVAPTINNEIGAVWRYAGDRPPTFYTPVPFGPEYYNRIENIKRSMFELAGISQMTASSKKPVGLDSGAAIREFTDIEAGRFSMQSQRYEEMHLDAARLVMQLAKHSSKAKNFRSVYAGRTHIERIDFDALSADDEKFTMRVGASSLMSRTPSGKLQGVMDLFGMGLMEKDEARGQLDHPDMEESTSLEDAARRDIMATVENLRKGVWEQPDPVQNLSYGVAQVQKAYLRTRREMGPERTEYEGQILEMMRAWISFARAELERIAKAPTPAPEAVGGAVGADAMPGEPIEPAPGPEGMMPPMAGPVAIDPALAGAMPTLAA